MKSFSYHPEVQQRLKQTKFDPIKPIFVVFADIWQNYAYTYCTKTALKEMLLKRTITQTNFSITSRSGLQNFLLKFNQEHEKSYHQHRSQFFYILISRILLWKEYIK